MAIGLPYVNITFEQKSVSARQRNERGAVGLVLEDTKALGITMIKNAAEIPADLSAKNKALINLALTGGTVTPDRIYLSVVTTGKSVEGVAALELKFINWLATPYATVEQKPTIVTSVTNMRANGSPIKYCVANHTADKPYVVNFTTGSIKVGATAYTTDEFTSRIVGLLAGTPVSMSTTYEPLLGVTEVQAYTKADLASRIGAGEFVIYHDGRKVKVARGVSSLLTTAPATPESFKKIKVFSIADIIKSDIEITLEDNYIGKFANSYDNKMLIVTAIRGYLQGLVKEDLLDPDAEHTCELDLDAQRTYLQSIGIDVEALKEEEIKLYNTQDKIFLTIRAKILDAIEEISIAVNI